MQAVKHAMLTGSKCPALKLATIHSGLTIGTGFLQQQQQQQQRQAHWATISRKDSSTSHKKLPIAHDDTIALQIRPGIIDNV
jgi:hypothetical protein